MRIPFDSLTVAAVLAELRAFVPAKLQKVSQPEPDTIVLELYSSAGLAWLLVSWSPEWARMHFVTRKPENPQPVPGLCATMRAHLAGGILVGVRQRGFDRLVELLFETAGGPHTVVAELMGRHANFALLGEQGRILACGRVVSPSRSVRPLQPGRSYVPPPGEPKPPIYGAVPEQPLQETEGASPFLVRLVEASGRELLDELRDRVTESRYDPVLARGHGAYPISVASLALPESPRASISIALEQHFSEAIPQARAEALRSSLAAQLKRVLVAREAALNQLAEAADAGRRAGKLQRMGELILAHGASIEPGSSVLETVDYDGTPIKVSLEPEHDFKANAQRLFDQARKAKSGLAHSGEQMDRLGADRDAVRDALNRLEAAASLVDIEPVRAEAEARRWLQQRSQPRVAKEERPYEGHRIKDLLGPRGFHVLYGDNATSNDFLTTRVARPNDYWLHVRGGVSAHVVIQTNNHPERVSKDVLEFAAQVAARNSPSKHSRYVAVDYTLKKHVRKPRGAAAGLATYTGEKTLDVMPA